MTRIVNSSRHIWFIPLILPPPLLVRYRTLEHEWLQTVMYPCCHRCYYRCCHCRCCCFVKSPRISLCRSSAARLCSRRWEHRLERQGPGLSAEPRQAAPPHRSDFFTVAGDASHTRTACGAAPAGNLGSNHPNRQQPKQPRKPKQPGSGRPSKHVVVLAVMGLVLQGCNDDISF